MAREVEETHRYAEVALGALKELGLTATPQNFELWYAHVEGRNPALSRDIQKALGPDGTFTQGQADSLHDLHIMRSDLARNVLDVVTRFEEELVELADIIEVTGESAHGHGEELQNLSTQINQSAEDYPHVAAILENVLAVTRSVREQNSKLELRLAESADEVATLRHNVEHIQQEAMTDPLTGVRNRKSFDTAISKFMRESKESGEPLTLILADVDHFKQFNDRWGHQTGDQVLRLVAEVMNSNVKGKDMLARYGGEEFAILLPGTSLEHAEMLGERIRRAIESRRLKKRRTEEDLGVVTMSMGVALYERTDSTESLIERADECLYAAKRAGRNRVMKENDVDFDGLNRAQSA